MAGLLTLPSEIVAQLATLVGDEATLKEMAVALGIAQPTVSKYLRRCDLYDAWRVSRQSRNVRAHRASQAQAHGVAVQHADTLRAMVGDGNTLEEMGQATGVTRERIRQVLNKFDCNAPRIANRQQQRKLRAVAAWLATPMGAVLTEFGERARAAGYTVERRVERPFRNGPLRVTLVVDGYVVNATYSRIARSVGGPALYFRSKQRSDTSILLLSTADGQRAAWWPPMTKMMYVHTRDWVCAPRYQTRSHPRADKVPRLYWVVDAPSSVAIAR